MSKLLPCPSTFLKYFLDRKNLDDQEDQKLSKADFYTLVRNLLRQFSLFRWLWLQAPGTVQSLVQCLKKEVFEDEKVIKEEVFEDKKIIK